MNSFISYLLYFSVLLPQIVNAQDTLFDQVKDVLLNDSKSFSVFRELHEAYLHDRSFNTPDSVSRYEDLYLDFYLVGTPLVRLINQNSLDSIFSMGFNQNWPFRKLHTRRHYVNLVSKINHFRTDNDIQEEDGQQNQFIIFLTSYYIIPDTK